MMEEWVNIWMFKCYYRATQGQRKEVKWKMNKDRSLRISYTQVIAKRKEVGEKYDKQSEVWFSSSVKG